MGSIAEILKKIMREQGWSQYDLERELKLSQPTISRIIGGSQPKHDTALRILALARRLTVINNSGGLETSQNRQGVPIVATIGSAGETHMLENALEMAPAPPTSSPDTLMAAKVAGNGMLPMFSDGWVIYWDQAAQMQQEPIERLLGKLCVVCVVGDHLFVRKLIQGRSPGHYDLWAANAEPLLDVEIQWAARVLWILPG